MLGGQVCGLKLLFGVYSILIFYGFSIGMRMIFSFVDMPKKTNKRKKVTLKIRSRENYSDGIKRILTGLNKDAARLVVSKSRVHISVHEVRTHIKKIRGILKLIRDEIGDEQYRILNDYYRHLGLEVAPVRDDTSQVELLLKMSKEIKSVALKKSIGKAMKKIRNKRKDHFSEFYSKGKDQSIRQKFLDQVDVVQQLNIKGDPDLVIRKSLKRTYINARNSMHASFKSNTNEDFHNWRKQVKYLTYHMMLLRKAWSPYFESYSDELSRLGTLLGEIHDLFLFRYHLKEGALSGLDKNLKTGLQRKIYKTHKILFKKVHPLGMKIFGESATRFTNLLYVFWTSNPGGV
jgi:CHAD domain-containing protein